MAGNFKVSILRFHRSVLLVSVLLVSSIVVSIYFGSIKPKTTRATIISGPFEFSLEMARTDFQRNDPQQVDNITFSVSMRNLSNKTIILLWKGHYGRMDQLICFDFYILDARGIQIYRWSNENAAIGSSYTKMLSPGEQWVNYFYWYQWTEASGYLDFAPSGAYSVVGSSHKFSLTIDNITKSGYELETPAIMIAIV